MDELYEKSPDFPGPCERYVYITRTYQIPGGSKGIRAPRGVGRTHDVLIFIATVAILFLATQKPDFRLF